MNRDIAFGVVFVLHKNRAARQLLDKFSLSLTALCRAAASRKNNADLEGRAAMSLLLLAHHSWEPPDDSPVFPGHKLHPVSGWRTRSGLGRRLLSPSESTASSWASARLPEVAPPAGSEPLRSIPGPSLPRRRTTPRAFPLQLRLSLPRSYGRAAGAPGHAAGRAGAGLRAAAGAGAAAGGRPLPGAGRGRQEPPLPGPIRGAESDRAVRAGEEGPSRGPARLPAGLWEGGSVGA